MTHCSVVIFFPFVILVTVDVTSMNKAAPVIVPFTEGIGASSPVISNTFPFHVQKINKWVVLNKSNGKLRHIRY